MAVYSTTEFQVAIDEVDYAGRLMVDSLIEKLQMSNIVNANQIGLTDELLDEKNVSWMLLNDQLIFHKDLPKTGEKVIITTVATGIKGIKFFREDFVYLNEIKEENLVAHNGSVWILADKDDHMPKRPNHIIDKKIILSQSENEFELAKGIENIESLENLSQEEHIFDYMVAYSDIDLNKHMHNTYYIRLALDAISLSEKLDINTEDFLVKEILIRYLKEVFLGQELKIFVRKEEGIYKVEGKTEEGESSFMVEVKAEIE